MHYLIYFLFPLILGVVAARILRQPLKIFAIGCLAFFIAWFICQTIAGVATQALGWGESTLLFAVIVSLSAGLFEESARYIAFSRLGAFRMNRTWRSSLTYAFGHHGMETMIVGFGLALTYLVVTYKPEAISDPVLLEQSQAVLALGTGAKLYSAFERLILGLLIHACFSAVVMLAVALSRPRFLFVAMAWHFAHNMIGFNLHRLSDHWLVSKAWIVFILVVYSLILIRVYRRLRGFSHQPKEQMRKSSARLGSSLGRTNWPLRRLRQLLASARFRFAYLGAKPAPLPIPACLCCGTVIRSPPMATAETETTSPREQPDLPVDPRTIAVWRWSALFSFMPPVAALLVAATIVTFVGSPIALALWIAWLLLLMAGGVVVWLYPPTRYRHQRYRVDGAGITIRQGVFWRIQSHLPRARIQHSDVSQGPLQRSYGVATLKLYTAGSRFTRTELPGLEYADAVALRDRLQREGHGDEV